MASPSKIPALEEDTNDIYRVWSTVLGYMLERKMVGLCALCDWMRVSHVYADAVVCLISAVYDVETRQALALIYSMLGKNVYITGGAGTGKSYVTRLIKLELLRSGLVVRPCGSTALAANNIGGETIHRTLSLYPHTVPDVRVGFYPDAWLQEQTMISTDAEQRPYMLKAHTQKDLRSMDASEESDPETPVLNEDDIIGDTQRLFLPTFSPCRMLELARIEVLLLDEVSMVSDHLLHLVHYVFCRAHEHVCRMIVRYQNLIDRLLRHSLIHSMDDMSTDVIMKYAEAEHCDDHILMFKMDKHRRAHLEKRVKRTVTTGNPFMGALQIIMVGDFAQLPPVLRDKEKVAVEKNLFARYAFQSKIWKEEIQPNHVVLTVVKRTRHPKYIQLLTHLRRGRKIRLDELLEITRPSQHPSPFLQMVNRSEEDVLLEEDMYIFPRRKVRTHSRWKRKPLPVTEQMRQPCVDNWNRICFNRMKTPIWNIPSQIEFDSEDVRRRAKPRDKVLTLRTNSVIQLTTNLPYSYLKEGDQSKRVLANGTIAVFHGMTKLVSEEPGGYKVIDRMDQLSEKESEFLMKHGRLHISIKQEDEEEMHTVQRTTFNIPRTECTVKMCVTEKVLLSEVNDPNAVPIYPGSKYTNARTVYNPTVKHFKVVLAHGLTVHKSQGLTLYDEFAVYIKDVFEGGQLYVMLSRAHDPSTMRLDYYDWDDTAIDWEEQIEHMAGKLIDAKIPADVLEYHNQIEKVALPFFIRER